MTFCLYSQTTPPRPRSPPNIPPTARLSPVHTIRMPPSWQRDGFQVLQHLLAELGSHAETQQAAGAPLKPSAFSPCTYIRPHHCRPCSHSAHHSARAQARTGLHWHRATASSHSEAPRGRSPEETASDLVSTTCIQSPEGSQRTRKPGLQDSPQVPSATRPEPEKSGHVDYKKLLPQLEFRQGTVGDTNVGGKVEGDLLFCKLSIQEVFISFKKHKQKMSALETLL